MKKSLFLLFTACVIFVKAQLPTIGATTIIPASPTQSDFVKIVTKVVTPNLGIVVDAPVFNVSHSTKTIKLNNCYWQGMLTAIQTHIDTFMIGQLQPGTYTIRLKPYMSSTQQHCTKIDSNEVVSTIPVTSTLATDISEKENENLLVLAYPNPVKDKIHFKDLDNFTEAAIYQLDGKLVTVLKVGHSELNVESLAKGIYFVKFFNGDKSKTIKVVKE